ncbi:MAG: hypothetical protein A2293_03965 [Elusimicrobia bacterium RIFOXYB2_FULL_49_7]|nr:MAG: hypothetical protein A2293_03965 [Elusimicrobia bacterium RIFOXYB2_FULL_49_7]
MFTRIVICAVIIILSSGDKRIQARTITDMAGRLLQVPDTIRSVYPTSPMGDVFMYTVAPEKMVGTSWDLCKEERAFLNDTYNNKPVLGGWYGKNTTGNPEVILKAHPDIILSVGNMDKNDAAFAERIQQQMGIPVVMTDGRLLQLNATYRFLGSLLKEELQADSLSQYCEQALKEVATAVSTVPLEKRIRVYYAEGLKGLETDPAGSMHTEVLDIVGGINVAEVPMIKGGYGRATVTFEQLLLWQPQVVIVSLDMGYAGGDGNYQRIIHNSDWNALSAIRLNRIYQIPTLPFNWFDRPPSVNRIIGIKWLAHLLYPEVYKIDMADETRRFYSLFYHKTLSEVELNQVLQNAVRK